MNNFPTKRDYWYGLTIAVFGGVFVFVSAVVNPSNINSKLGLVSTVASIILSVIAIIYTLVDSSNSKQTSSKIITASETISNVTKNIETSSSNLTSLITKFSDLDILNRISGIETIVKGVDENVSTVLKNTMESFVSPIKSPISSSNKEETTRVAKALINSLPPIYKAKQLLYIIHKLIGINKGISKALDILNKSTILKKEEFINPDARETFFAGTVGILNSLRCYAWNEEGHFTNFNVGLNDIIKFVEDTEKEFVKSVDNELKK